MAFNFNWSPLIADTSRAKEMLTAALNKSPKPPIIVDDIIVNELNLGSTPPELEILEIGDLAEDRFRGIFKMSYRGDAYLTLKTRVQANPLNTYLSTKSDFASPQPLAAASSLTIPLQITLSDIRLSGFVILVFSRQKGITLVFRNDPLESLKVSSTFDSIPFVRNYLQKEIEAQLRVLFMDDLPAIIHRLSLRVWNPEYRQADEKNRQAEAESQAPVDPLASPPQFASDAYTNQFDDSDINFSLDAPTEIHASFSQKNLLRLAALTESQRTLSLFTPSLRDTVFRAWAGAHERGESSGTATPNTRPHALSRLHSSVATHSAWSSAASETSETYSHSSRPSLSNVSSAATVYTMSSGRSRPTANRKRKHRTVNLRRSLPAESSGAEAAQPENFQSPKITVSEPPTSPIIEASPVTYAQSSMSASPKVRFNGKEREHWSLETEGNRRSRPTTPRKESSLQEYPDPDATPRPATREQKRRLSRTQPQLSLKELEVGISATAASIRPTYALPRSLSATGLAEFGSSDQFTGGILEQAWLAKVQAETSRRAQWEKTMGRSSGLWDRMESEEERSPPPAYAA
ncbi:hypothetical protein K461DRAFT_275800 [Myriangium duriaei CBS 260.36]|uniref:Mitochondrial distribution and morphology protein 34 n=1 Tax=Myriangium duriaei CBS 260.36 TaxID=1168546 RepID=A0A9P4J7M0_9PEZI|nr:hypothetical protein K461DRAFT_275800 [Myriangium duriaei CBS 260.36]